MNVKIFQTTKFIEKFSKKNIKKISGANDLSNKLSVSRFYIYVYTFYKEKL